MTKSEKRRLKDTIHARLGEGVRKAADERAAILGVSTSEYVRNLVLSDLSAANRHRKQRT